MKTLAILALCLFAFTFADEVEEKKEVKVPVLPYPSYYYPYAGHYPYSAQYPYAAQYPSSYYKPVSAYSYSYGSYYYPQQQQYKYVAPSYVAPVHYYP